MRSLPEATPRRGCLHKLQLWGQPLLAVALLSVATAAFAQTPRLSNGRIESHATTNIARDLPALAATLTEPMWIGYAQPLIDGDHQMCDYWNNGNRYTQSTDPIRLEPADFFFVMFRIEEKQITRIRTYSANCPLDAGGKAVHVAPKTTSTIFAPTSAASAGMKRCSSP